MYLLHENQLQGVLTNTLFPGYFLSATKWNNSQWEFIHVFETATHFSPQVSVSGNSAKKNTSTAAQPVFHLKLVC